MNWSMAHLEVVAVTLFTLLAAVEILQQRRTPQSTVAWLLFIILVPYMAIPLFLALGFRKRSGHLAAIPFPAGPAPDRHTSGAAPPPIADVFQAFDLPPARSGHDMSLLGSGAQAYDALIDLCQTAKTDLDALFYIVARDEVGTAFVRALTARAKAGVRVRLLIDRLGNLHPPRQALAELRAAGGEVLYFAPILRRPKAGRVNLRNHRKMVIADGQRVFAGGMNVGADYMTPAPNSARWRDLGYLLHGPSVADHQRVFEANWQAAGGAPRAGASRPLEQSQSHHGAATVQLVPSGPDIAEDPLHDGLLTAIYTAQRRVWIVTPYFIPTEFLGKALAIAAKRGVDVRIVLPRSSNQALADVARGAYLREMQEAGCTVRLCEGPMVHAKMGLIDDIGYVGSANFDVRSMLLNFETVLFVYDAATVAKLVAWYDALEQTSVAGLPHAGRARRVFEGAFRLGAPIL